jgi:hypothetical protein
MIHRSDFGTLIREPEGQAVSIYMPAHYAIDNAQDKIRFKNFIKEAENQLKNRGMRAPEAARMLEPGIKLLNDSAFWKYQGDGLALFFSGKGFKYFRAPVSFSELVEVDSRFHIRPLLNLFNNDGACFVLAVGQRLTRLLHCTRDSFMDITPEQMPRNISEVLRFDQFQKQRQYRTVGSPGLGKRNTFILHGQAQEKEYDKADILRYFREIDRAVNAVIKEENNPLVLVSMDYLQPIYREINKYSNLLDEGLTENPDDFSEDKIHRQAWAFAESYCRNVRNDAVKKYRELAGTGYSTDNMEDVLIASADGKVGTLFIDLESQQWGKYDAEARKVKLLPADRPGAEDLLDLVTVNTLLHKGIVYGLDKEELKGVQTAAAILRY